MGVFGSEAPALWLRSFVYSILTILYCAVTSRYVFKVHSVDTVHPCQLFGMELITA